MDPISQGVLGASASTSLVKKPGQLVSAAVLGWLGGMAADLDVLIRSSEDPLLFLEYHRQFTHSLIFIPIGGAICGLLLHALIFRRKLRLRESIFFATLGYATHGLLDACTTYGTVLLWPFSNMRVAWNNVSIIDPLFTIPLLVLVGLSIARRRVFFGRLALGYAVFYLLLGVVQRERAETLGYELAHSRGHQPRRLEAKPSFANLILWKIVYETESRYHVDAVRVAAGKRVYPGESIAKLDVKADFPWLDPKSTQARDIERFRWFSNDYLAVDPSRPHRVIDIRYSMIPNEINSLWGIKLDPKRPEKHVEYTISRERSSEMAKRLWRMISGRPL